MSYQTSYDWSGSGPFKPNKNRGYWSSSSDFFYACMCNAFRMDTALGFGTIPMTKYGGVYMLMSMLVNVVLFAFPVVFIQSFLRQFSSTGFISAFRVSPLFKGIGYIALASNLCSLTFYAIFAAVPILFFINSFHQTLPWSCDAWLQRNYTNDIITHCNGNQTEEFYSVKVASVEYFWEQFQDSTFLVSLYGCVIVVWLIVAVGLCNSTEKIGQMLRYCSLTLITLLVIVFIRMLFLPGAMESLQKVVQTEGGRRFKEESLIQSIFMAPMLTLATFGPGWGCILSMASYNRFKTDINKFSLLICFSQLAVLFLMGFLCMFTESHLMYNKLDNRIGNGHRQWTLLLSIPSSLETMEFPHFWTWMFLAVLIIGNFNLMISQMFSILTALFDEYEILRLYKLQVTLGISGILALLSAWFCTKNGIYLTEVLAELSISTQTIVNLLLLIIVLWVYGRERFQRDVEFMTSQVLQKWKINIMRFITPLFAGITLFIGFAFLIYQSLYKSDVSIWVIFTTIPWLALPVYCVIKLLQTNGTFAMRFKRCVKPTDWYPIDSEDRQRYEETVCNAETSQPLTTIVL